MEFIYYIEKAKFEKEHEATYKDYETMEMPKKVIAEIKEMDWDEFKQRRVRFENDMDIDFPGTDGAPPMESFKYLIEKNIEKLSYEDEYFMGELDGFVESIELEPLHNLLKSITRKQLIILILISEFGYSETEVAAIMKISQQAVSKQILRIRKKSELFFA